jgi:FlaA1/EpsC-like NDP-sugar epimerase
MFDTKVVVVTSAHLVGLSRLTKRILLIVNDFCLLSLALWLALSFRYATPYVPPTRQLALVLAAAPFIGMAIFVWGGLYQLVTRYLGARGTSRLLGCLSLAVLLWSLLVLLSGVSGIPRSVVIMYGVIGFALLLGSRQIIAWLLRIASGAPLPAGNPAGVVIYGAGQTGVQLLEAIRQNGSADVVGFLDSKPSMWGQYVGGVKVYRPEKLATLVARGDVKFVYMAIPDSERRQRSAILNWLQHYDVRVRLLPAMEDLASGRVTINALRPIVADDLLGRDPALVDAALLARNIKGKAVMVTGAGGSIGSELVRNIMRQGPSRLVLFEISEAALYLIEMEVTEYLESLPTDAPKPAVVAVIGSVLDAGLVEKTIRQNDIATIYHAAAYKHVPLVEMNPITGISNNTFGTKVVADAAMRANVGRMVLISTDKAVRPTNVMGASKRLAEMVLQAYAADPEAVPGPKSGHADNKQTVFAIVRFGNVLDSSGSVMHRFRKQIAAGGPVSVTHKDVIRYFMSIPEAAGLVIQAGALATSGEVFVLEMGEPVRIDDLARSMIRLSGLDVKDEQNPDGDIAIAYTGLRPGEKLYEELLLSESATGTEHPRIMRISDPYLSVAEINAELDVLKTAMANDDVIAVRTVLKRVVEGYEPSPMTPPPEAPMPPPSRMLH